MVTLVVVAVLVIDDSGPVYERLSVIVDVVLPIPISMLFETVAVGVVEGPVEIEDEDAGFATCGN